MSFPNYPGYKESGLEWLGEIPDHWQIDKFRYVFRESGEKIEDEVVGKMLSVSGYRGIEVKVYDDENKRRSEEELQGYRIVRSGQLVVNTMWLNYAGLGVSVHEGHVSPAYRSYWIERDVDRRYIHHLMRSATYVQGYTQLLTGIRPNSLQMSRDDLMAMPVLLAPVREQTQIARFLDHETAKIDALIHEQKRLIELLQEKRQAVISHAVTKGLDPDVPMKDSGVEWLGEVPAHWRMVPLKYLCSFSGGGTPSKENLEYWSGEIPWVSPKDMKSQWIQDSIDRITELAVAESSTSLVKPNALLIVVRSGILQRTIPVGINVVDVTLNQDMKALRFSIEGFQRYFALLIKGFEPSWLLEWRKQGATVESIEQEYLAQSLVPVPPVEEIEAIVARLDELVDQYQLLEDEALKSSKVLKERRSALISAAVTGKIDVRDWQPPADESAFDEEVRQIGMEARV